MVSKAELIRSTEAAQRGTTGEGREELPHATREQEIRKRAYEIYLRRGGVSGYELEDWFQAERELPTNLTAVLQQILQNTTNIEVLKKLMTPDATYVSLNFDNPELKRIEPWTGTHKGPQALSDVFAAIQRFWRTLDFSEFTGGQARDSQTLGGSRQWLGLRGGYREITFQILGIHND